AKKIFNYLIPVMSEADFSEIENIKNLFSEAQKALGIKGKKFFQPLRIAITGQTHGPEFPLTIQILGKDKVVKFLSEWR
ncbi:MAG: glutamate--tRNA ligase, partial [Ignavibacteria bacterium]|nr:glutamate--tRNA ligase [Ignavibacteria bacterium]